MGTKFIDLLIKNMVLYSREANFPDKSAKAFTSNLQVHFKNTRETASAIKGKHLAEAKNYLMDVVAHKRCVLFRQYNGYIGRTSQAKCEGRWNGQGVWSEKSCKLILNLLKNAR